MPSIHLRAATLADIPAVVAIMHTAYAEYTDKLDPPSGVHNETTESVATKLAKGGIALAEVDGRIGGSVIFEPRDGYYYLGRLAVLPDQRGNGLGRLLTEYVETQARRAGVFRVELGVRVALPRNVAFYRRLGYTILAEGRHPGYDQTTFYRMGKDLSQKEHTDERRQA